MKKHYTYLLLSAFILFSYSKVFAEEEILEVSTSPLSKLLVHSENSVPATIISLNHSVISAEITGRALTVKMEAGDLVKKNDMLLSLDCRSYSLAKKQAEAGLKVARTQLSFANKQFNRNKRLLKKGIISREIYERTESSKLVTLADIQLKKAAIDSTSLAISRCEISAPFTGQVTERLIQEGQLVTPGTPLFKIMQYNNLEARARLSSSNIKKLMNASELEFVGDDARFTVSVRTIIKNIDESTRTQEVRLTLPENAQASAGLSGRIQWTSKEQRLPAEYVIRRGENLGVMLAVDIVEGIGKVKFHPLANAQEGQSVQINLPSNTSIITLNRYRAKDGNSIKIK